ncbi:C2H2 type zinc finger domain protein [Apiospora phragmitis]|uniref:C2H2 type zinc finger domain protein n=1 Tax=Apiospora phragmitis TaxID=2905665 RepID=A0ABR1TRL5_9PEZI
MDDRPGMGPASGISGSAGPVDTQMFPRTSHPDDSSPDLLGVYGHSRNMPAQDAISQWYATNDGPWIPKGLALPEDDERSPSRIHTMNLQGHTMGYPRQYRERYVPSECETTPLGMAPSDSGYGSHAAKQSVTATSVYDEPMDRNTETQSLAGHLSEFHFPTSFAHGGSQDMLSDLAGVPEQTGDYEDFQISPSLEPGQSQFWSHDEDHNTEEDLHHIASVPADYSRAQLDDTRMALGHMTGGTGASHNMVEPASEDEPVSMPDPLEAIGPIQPQLSQSLRPSMQNNPERQDFEDSNSQFISPEDLRQEHQLSTSSLSSSTTGTETSPSSTSYEGEERRSPAAGAKPRNCDGSMSSTSKRECGKQGVNTATAQEPPVVSVSDISSLQLELKDPDKRRKLVEVLQLQGILKEFGFKKESSPVVETRPEEISQDVKPENYHACTESGCDKKFQRPCELKKHLKRHSKPYGCTFQNCSKRFGSKNDWKRHENSQHFLHEAWRCDLQRNNGRSREVCGKLIHRRETFKEHLSRNHNLQGDELEIKLEHCRVGRNCEARFWCGFCERIIEIERKGLGAFTERFNHIDDHFSGREGLPRKQIDDWKGVDPDAPPVESLSSDSEDGDSAPPSQPAPLSAPSHPARKGTPKEQHSHPAGPKKRKRDDEDVVGHAKRAKAPPPRPWGLSRDV